MYCIVTLSCLVAAVLGAPAPGPSPVASPQLFWPWSTPIQSFYYNPLVAPRSLIWQPVAVVPSHDTARATIPQSIERTDESKSSHDHDRIKRDVQAQLPHELLAPAPAPVPDSEDPDSHKTVSKRQAYYSSLQMPWTMPFLSVPVSYAWSTQSFGGPSSSSSWSVVTL